MPRFASLLFAALLTACSTTAALNNVTYTTFGGETWFARQYGSPDVWQAGPDNPYASRKVPAQMYARNVQAIEQASGCKVVPGSESWPNNYMVAAVTCP